MGQQKRKQQGQLESDDIDPAYQNQLFSKYLKKTGSAEDLSAPSASGSTQSPQDLTPGTPRSSRRASTTASSKPRGSPQPRANALKSPGKGTAKTGRPSGPTMATRLKQIGVGSSVRTEAEMLLLQMTTSEGMKTLPHSKFMAMRSKVAKALEAKNVLCYASTEEPLIARMEPEKLLEDL